MFSSVFLNIYKFIEKKPLFPVSVKFVALRTKSLAS